MAWNDPRTWVAGETLTAALLNAEVRDNFDAGFPVGSLQYIIRAATSVETAINGGWLECNGVAVSRTTYAALNTLLSGLSYPFGSGNGTTTFNIPDLAGRALYAQAASGHADVDALGDSDGLTKASRSPKHNSTDNLAISPNPHAHDAFTVVGLELGASNAGVGTGTTDTGTTSLSITGSVGPGGTRPDDMGAYLVAGVWAVKY